MTRSQLPATKGLVLWRTEAWRSIQTHKVRHGLSTNLTWSIFSSGKGASLCRPRSSVHAH
jgi:hypothetical protein